MCADIQMPVMDGYEAASRLRAHEAKSGTELMVMDVYVMERLLMDQV